MRSDFKKLLVERGRHRGPFTLGSYRAVRNRNKVGDEDTGFTQGMRRPYGYYDKEVSDFLGPLYRFIQGRVGERWDDVYSEVCAHLKGRNAIQQHVVDHLLSEVEANVGIGKHGKLIGANGERLDSRHHRKPLYYVDPRNGILCKLAGQPHKVVRPESSGECKGTDRRVFRKLAPCAKKKECLPATGVSSRNVS